MPIRRKQKSRLNSVVDVEAFKQLFPKIEGRSSKKSLTIEEKSSNAKSSEKEIFDYEDNAGFDEHSEGTLQAPLSRTSMLLLDYRQFLAARIIQKFARGWLARLKYKRILWATIIIQKEWRCFYYQRMYYRKLEDLVQKSIEEFYFKSALKIQSLWRGWWVREHIHDHTHLLRLQVTAGEDLLHCVAFKLHHLQRTHQIPGIYSIRNSNVLSKVEKLLASLTFKTCTERVRRAHDFRDNIQMDGKKCFKKSAYATKVPFPGHNIHNICAPRCMPLYSEKDADRKMTKILRMYEEVSRGDPRLMAMQRKRQKFSKKYRGICKPPPSSFCGDVVHSMRKWKIIEDKKMEIDPNVFQRPQNLENFLTECQSWWNMMHVRCYCRQSYAEENAIKDINRPHIKIENK